jgi:hypothetical protein
MMLGSKIGVLLECRDGDVEKLRNAIRRQEHTGALALFPQPLTGMPK